MMMRKIFNLAIIALMALGAVSCTKDTEISGGDGNGGNTNKMVFSFEGINDGVVPYSTVAAENFEKAVTDATVYIFEYKADQSGELVWVQNEDFSTTSNYLLIVDDVSTFVDKRLVAYFTINNGATFDEQVDLTAYTVGSGKKESDLITEATDAITGKVAREDFLMTGARNGSLNFPAWGEYPVEVKRRVARFDIRNQSPTAIVTVNKVTVRKAMDQGYVFGDATPSGSSAVTGTAIATDIVYDLTAAQYGDTGAKNLTWVEEWNTTDADPAKHYIESKIANSVFYLNPTDLIKATPTDGTQLFIEATIGSTTKVFELSLSQDIEILANYRYILTLTEDLRFRITVADWDDYGTEIPTKPLETPLAPLAAPAGAAVNSYVGNTVALKPAAGGTVTFTMTASSAQGTEWAWDAAPAGVSVVEVPSTTVTYASPYFESKYTITVDSDLSAGESFFQTLTITDKANPSNTYPINFMYDKDNADVATQINTTTVPNESFRNFLIDMLGSAKPTQGAIDAVTTINLLGKPHLATYTSLDGIEIFKNLTTLTVPGTGITSLDLSHFTKLADINVGNTPLTNIVLGSQPNLTNLQANITANLNSIDISGCPALVSLGLGQATVQSPTCISEIIWGTHPSLKTLGLNGTSVAGLLDLTKFPSLESVGLINTLYTSVDISANKLSLKSLDISIGDDRTKSMIVYVWEGFDTETPSNSIGTFRAENVTAGYIVK